MTAIGKPKKRIARDGMSHDKASRRDLSHDTMSHDKASCCAMSSCALSHSALSHGDLSHDEASRRDLSRIKASRRARLPGGLIVWRGQSGFSVAELLIALALLAFLSTSLLTIIGAGGGAFQNILDEKSAQSEARIAISYITVKLRQYSSRGMVSIIPSDSLTSGKNVLKIDTGVQDGASAGAGAGMGMAGESYYIYFEEAQGGGTGMLVEKNSALPKVGDPAGANKIAEISDFNITYANEEQTVIYVSVSCETPGGTITRDVSVKLRV